MVTTLQTMGVPVVHISSVYASLAKGKFDVVNNRLSIAASPASGQASTGLSITPTRTSKYEELQAEIYRIKKENALLQQKLKVHTKEDGDQIHMDHCRRKEKLGSRLKLQLPRD